MPFTTTWEDRGIVWRFRDYVTADEIEAANEEFYADERSDDAKYQIIDASKVTGVEWDDSAITAAAAMDLGAETGIKNVKVAYVAPDADIMALIEKYADISRRMNSSWHFRGFTTLEEAREWISPA